MPHIWKKPKTDEGLVDHSHPLGVKPRGNLLLLSENEVSLRTKLLGPLFSVLPDEVLITILGEIDSPHDLLAVSHTCRALYAYAFFDEFWKRLTYNCRKPSKWYGSWRRTCLALDASQEARINVRDQVFSDILFRPFQCSQINYNAIIDFAESSDRSVIPTYFEHEVTLNKFDNKLYKAPFKIKLETPCADWSIDDLVNTYADTVFRQEYMDWKLTMYNDYMNSNLDESPLYLFDCSSEAMRNNDIKYKVPLDHIFGHERDFFELFGHRRPDHRWLIIGPERSGSTFHKDPNGTSAWNSLISGKKYWIMFPPDQLPAGVLTDGEESEVTAPSSLAEWFLSGFYEQAKHEPGFHHTVCEKNECMYVPSGWWHLVVNLTECVALTGNFVVQPNLGVVLDFLKNKKDQISGFKDPSFVYQDFVDKLKEANPKALAEGLLNVKNIEERRAGRHRKYLWNTIENEDNTPFSFGFDTE